jgi:Cytochrome P460
MMYILKLSLLVAIAPLCWGALVKTESPEKVPYPEGYRRWTHVRSGLTGPESPDYQLTGGLHHIYANDKAMEGYEGGRFPDGSVIVYDLLKVQTKDGVTLEGERRYLTVMHKDSKRFADTGGWGFEVFLKDSRKDRTVWPNAKTKCYECHASQKDRDFVFGSFRK